MKVIQFGFSDKGAHLHLPHRYTPNTAAYTGTHDNDTTQGWWQSAGKVERSAVETYVGPVNGHPVWPLLRSTSGSVAQLALVPAQDLLELGSEARMNMPAVARSGGKLEAATGGGSGRACRGHRPRQRSAGRAGGRARSGGRVDL
jgi:4-alpha-glucanotransferase